MARADDLDKIAAKVASIHRDEDVTEKLHQIEIDAAVSSALKANNWWWIKKLVAMCLSIWTFVIGACYAIGVYCYENSIMIKAGVDAMIKASGNHHD